MPQVHHPHVSKARQYCRDVLNGKIAACTFVRLACERHKSDLERSKDSKFPYEFDAQKAERICKFISKLVHVKGKWAGKFIELETWQCFLLCMIFGWVRKSDGARRFRQAYIEVPRKNAKSTLAAGIGLYMLVADDESGAEVYSGATSEKQAWEVFAPAKQMAKKSPGFLRHWRVRVAASKIVVPANNSKFEPVIKNPGDGSSPTCPIHDEFHEHDSPDQADTMKTGNAPETLSVMACVKVLSETLGSLPMVLYAEDGEGNKKKARNHPLYETLRYQPNNWQTWIEFAEMMTAHVALRGNAYAEIIYAKSGDISQLVPLHPDRVMPALVNNERVYQYSPLSGPRRILLKGEVLHVPGLSFDGISGLDPITYARHAIGLAKGAEVYGSRFFMNDARPGVVIKHPGPKAMSDKAYNNFRESWEERHSGAKRSHRPVVLEEGMDVKQIGISPENAQFLETRKFQKNEIAGFFRVPPHMIGSMEDATFSNIEHQGRSFVDNTMLPWFVRWEQALRRDLLISAADKKSFTIEIEPAAILRGDLKSRNESYAIARNGGWMSVNDIRKKENMNPIEGGDRYLEPLNMVEVGENGDDEDQDAEDKSRSALTVLIENNAERILRKESAAVQRALSEPEELRDAALLKFYKSHAGFIAKSLDVSEDFAAEWCKRQINAAAALENGVSAEWMFGSLRDLKRLILEEIYA